MEEEKQDFDSRIRGYNNELRNLKNMYKFLGEKNTRVKALMKSFDTKYNMIYCPTGKNIHFTKGKKKEWNDELKKEDYIIKNKRHQRCMMYAPVGIANEIKDTLEKNRKDGNLYLKGKLFYDSKKGEKGRVMIPVRVSANNVENKKLSKNIQDLYLKIKDKLIEHIDTSIKKYKDKLNDKKWFPPIDSDEYKDRPYTVKEKIRKGIKLIDGILENLEDLKNNVKSKSTANINEKREPRVFVKDQPPLKDVKEKDKEKSNFRSKKTAKSVEDMMKDVKKETKIEEKKEEPKETKNEEFGLKAKLRNKSKK